MAKKKQEEKKEGNFLTKTHPIPTWVAILVALVIIVQGFFNIAGFILDRPTNELMISEGPTADPHDDLNNSYLSKVKLSFDGKYAMYYTEWKIQNKFGKSAGFEEINGCNKLGSVSDKNPEPEIECMVDFHDPGEYKVTINVYYLASELEMQDSEEKIEWLLENGEKASPPWKYKVYVSQEDVQ